MIALLLLLARPKPPIIKHLAPPEWAYASDLRIATAGLFAIATVVSIVVWVSAARDVSRARSIGREGPILASRMLSGDELLRAISNLLLCAVYALAVYLATPVPGLALAQTMLGAVVALLMATKSIRMAVLRRRLSLIRGPALMRRRRTDEAEAEIIQQMTDDPVSDREPPPPDEEPA